MISLRKIPQCFSCRYHDQTGHLVCAVHPSGPSGDRCADFEVIQAVAEHGSWNPEGWAFEGGELLKTAASYLPQYDASHPIVTGRCPRCGHGLTWVDRQICIGKSGIDCCAIYTYCQ